MHKIYEIQSVKSESTRPKTELQREYLFRGSVKDIGSNLEYIDDEGNTVEFVLIGEGSAVPFEGTEGDYTNPNLHRRIDPQDRESPEESRRQYMLSIQNLNSYRLTKINTYGDENIDETP